jgi:hypothetical protein
LVKLGAIGASLAFLLLSFILLRQELKGTNPRREALGAIRQWQWVALIFLVVGVLSEFLLVNGPPLERVEVNAAKAVSPKLAPDMDVYVAVRKKGTDASSVGKYPLLFGPYSMGNTGVIRKSLAKSEAAELGAECAQFTAVGVNRKDRPTALTSPFDPASIFPIPIIFDTASACVTRKNN